MILKPSYYVVKEANQLRKIEYCGRVCYKSEDKITHNSYIDFIKQRMLEGHYPILEHGSATFFIKGLTLDVANDIYEVIKNNPYLKATKIGGKNLICSGNLRAWYEFLCFEPSFAPTVKSFIFSYFYFKYPVVFETLFSLYEHSMLNENSVKNYFEDENVLQGRRLDIIKEHSFLTVKFTINRKMSHELVRHRKMSFMQESTRYVDYKKHGVNFVFDESIIPKKHRSGFLNTLTFFETYITDMYLGVKSLTKQSQIASLTLPEIAKTEIIVTGRLADWDYLIDTRTGDKVYPELKNLMCKFRDIFYEPYIEMLERKV